MSDKPEDDAGDKEETGQTPDHPETTGDGDGMTDADRGPGEGAEPVEAAEDTGTEEPFPEDPDMPEGETAQDDHETSVEPDAADGSDAPYRDPSLDETTAEADESHGHETYEDPHEVEGQDEPVDDHEDHGTPVAARLLTWLVLLIVGGAAALWGAPKVAPLLPQGLEPVAKWLTPGASEAEQEVATLRTALQTEFERNSSAFEDRLGELGEGLRTETAAQVETLGEDLRTAASESAAELEALKAEVAERTAAIPTAQEVGEMVETAVAPNREELGVLGDRLATLEAGKLDNRVAAVEARIEGMEGELSSLYRQLEGVTVQGGAFTEETVSAMTRFNATVDGIRAEVQELASQNSDLIARVEQAQAVADRRVNEAEASAARRIEEVLASTERRIGEIEDRADERAAAAEAALTAAQEEMRAQVDQIRADAEERIAAISLAAEEKAQELEQVTEERIEAAVEQKTFAELDAALKDINAALLAGSPYAGPLETVMTSAELQAPAEPLAVTAESGVRTMLSLQSGFSAAAHDAIRATVRQEVEDDSVVGRLSSFLEAQVATRSLTPREGDDADAVLSRAEAKLRNGDLTGALAELDALPEPAQAAMGDWLSDARARDAAFTALDDTRQALATTN